LALLTLNAPAPAYAEVAYLDASLPAVCDQLYVVGNPLDLRRSVIPANVTALRRGGQAKAIEHLHGSTDVLELNIGGAHGLSGAPAFNARGGIVGIYVSGYAAWGYSFNFCVAAKHGLEVPSFSRRLVPPQDINIGTIRPSNSLLQGTSYVDRSEVQKTFAQTVRYSPRQYVKAPAQPNPSARLIHIVQPVMGFGLVLPLGYGYRESFQPTSYICRIGKLGSSNEMLIYSASLPGIGVSSAGDYQLLLGAIPIFNKNVGQILGSGTCAFPKFVQEIKEWLADGEYVARDPNGTPRRVYQCSYSLNLRRKLLEVTCISFDPNSPQGDMEDLAILRESLYDTDLF